MDVAAVSVKPLAILMVDDHPVVRAGFRYVLNKQHNYRVLEAESAEEAYSTYRSELPDVIVMDISMPGIGGLEGIRKLKAFNQDIKIIVLSVRDDPTSVAHAMSLGVLAYLSKNCVPEELVSAIRQVMKGEVYLSSSLQMDVHENRNASSLKKLTKREFEVFQYLAQGDSISVIAATLNRSVKTMNNHRSSIMKKLHAKNTTQLALIAQREGVLVH
jgi:two-component system invasion response regulator UvrY